MHQKLETFSFLNGVGISVILKHSGYNYLHVLEILTSRIIWSRYVERWGKEKPFLEV